MLTKNDNGYDYDSVKRWYTNIDFEDYGDMFLCIHLPGHWAGARICMSSKTISYMDSKKPTTTIAHERMHRIEKYLNSKIDRPGK